MHKKFTEVRPCSFRVMRADIQTNKQTNILITILDTRPGDEVIIVRTHTGTHTRPRVYVEVTKMPNSEDND